ncbi:MAG: basic amino acid ABC transporter substrate-binding protein [bacterium]
MAKRKAGLFFAVVVFIVVLLVGGVISPAAEKKVYIVASDISWPPFEWKDEAGNYVGFDLDVMRAIAKLQGYEIEIVDVAFDSIIPGVVAGKYDIGASGFTITAKREEVIDFSGPYYSSDQAVLIGKDSGLNIITALSAGHTVGAQRGTTGADWIKTNLVEKGVKVELKLYETYPMAVLDLINKNIDAVIQDEPASRASAAKEKKRIEIAGIIVTGEEFGFLVKEGDPHGLLPKINEGMLKLRASGEWDRLMAKYFGG